MVNSRSTFLLIVEVTLMLPIFCIRPPTMIRHPKDSYSVFENAFVPTNYSSSPYYQRRDLINKSITLDCIADGDPKPRYFWIKFEDPDYEFLDNTVSESNLSIRELYDKSPDYMVYDSEEGDLELELDHQDADKHTGIYKCFVYNKHGVTFSNTAYVSNVYMKIYENEPLTKKINILTEEVYSYKGSVRSLECLSNRTITANPMPKYYWKKGLELVTYRKTLVEKNGRLWFSHVDLADNSTTEADLYTCVAETEYQSLPLRIIKLIVLNNTEKETEIPNFLGMQSNAGAIRSNKSQITLTVNQPVSLSCFFTGTNVSVDWYLPVSLKDNYFNIEGQILHIKQMRLEYEGLFSCGLAVPKKRVYSSVPVRVYQSVTLIEISQNLTLYEGEPAEVRCSGVGKPQPNFAWFKNARILSRPKLYKNYSIYYFKKLELKDTGTYGCWYSNGVGAIYKDFYINVLKKPIQLSNTFVATVASVIVAAALIFIGTISIVTSIYKKKPMESTDHVSLDQIPKTGGSYDIDLEDIWHFNRARLQLLDILGEGNFGRVYLGEMIVESETGGETLHKVAVKTTLTNSTDSAQADLLQEVDIMKRVGQHCNVVKLIGTCTEKIPLLLVMELLHQSLIKFLRYSRDNKYYVASQDIAQRVTSQMLVGFAFQIARGMQHVSSQGIVHRDVAARNVLLSLDHVCKIADFGLARIVNEKETYARRINVPLPIRWMAPEALSTDEVSMKSDIWSFGVLLWELTSLGATPYPGKRAQEVKELVCNRECMEKPKSCSDELYSLMLQCWCEDPTQRPDFATCADVLASMLERDGDYIQFENFSVQEYEHIDNVDEEII